MQPSPLSMNLQPAARGHAGDAQTLQALLPGIQDSIDRLRQRAEDMGFEQLTPETLETVCQEWRNLRETLEFSGLSGASYAVSQAIVALDACHHPAAYTETLGDALASLLIALPAYVELMARGESDCPTLLFHSDALRVVLATVPSAARGGVARLTERASPTTIELTARELPRFGIARPRIAVAGLNPHAGEHGLFGDEEARVIAPAIAGLPRRRESTCRGRFRPTRSSCARRAASSTSSSPATTTRG